MTPNFWNEFWPQFWASVAATMTIAGLTFVFTYIIRTRILRALKKLVSMIKNNANHKGGD